MERQIKRGLLAGSPLSIQFAARNYIRTSLLILWILWILWILCILLIFCETSGDAVELATLAFFVVFRVLIKLFFSIDMVFTGSLLEFFIPLTLETNAGEMPNSRRAGRKTGALKTSQLVPKY